MPCATVWSPGDDKNARFIFLGPVDSSWALEHIQQQEVLSKGMPFKNVPPPLVLWNRPMTIPTVAGRQGQGDGLETRQFLHGPASSSPVSWHLTDGAEGVLLLCVVCDPEAAVGQRR